MMRPLTATEEAFMKGEVFLILREKPETIKGGIEALLRLSREAQTAENWGLCTTAMARADYIARASRNPL